MCDLKTDSGKSSVLRDLKSVRLSSYRHKTGLLNIASNTAKKTAEVLLEANAIKLSPKAPFT